MARMGVPVMEQKSAGVVLLGFAEALSAPEVVWSLADAGYTPIAFARKARRACLRHSRHVAVYEITPPERNCKAALADLRELLKSVRTTSTAPHVLFPIDDTSVWLCSLIGSAPGWVFAGPRGAHAEVALNKQKQIEIARGAGFNVPETSIVSTKRELSSCTSRFPVILRPANAISIRENTLLKGQNWICSDESELNQSLSVWNESVPLLVQPFLEGRGEGVFGIATENGIVAWSAHQRLRMMNPHGSGSSACISQTVPDEVRAPVEAFIKRSGWRGMFMIELLRTPEGKRWFVEFNGRAWGSMALSRRQSLEYPAWSVKQAAEPSARLCLDSPVKEGISCRHLGRELMHLLFVLRGSRSRAVKTWPSFWKTFFAVFRFSKGTSFYNWRRDDWRVFVSNSWYTIRDQMFKAH
jgi:predicted ATP-grasp superfamily ATP-dependent carboligase